MAKYIITIKHEPEENLFLAYAYKAEEPNVCIAVEEAETALQADALVRNRLKKLATKQPDITKEIEL